MENDIENRPHTEWTCDGIIPAGAFVVLYGAAGTGKSFTALDMAAAISSGQPWHGHETRQGPVIYIAAEGIGDLGLRHQPVRIGRNLDDLPEIGYLLEPVNLFSQSDVKSLVHTLAGQRPATIIADTLARSMDGGDENVVKDMNVVIKSVDYLRRTTGAAVMLIHHTGHDKSRERGSSALKGAADVFIRLSADVSKSVTLHCDKMKMSKAFDDVTLRFEPTGDSLAVVSHPVTPVLDGHEQASLTLVSHDPLTHKAWLEVFEKACHGSRSSFSRALKALRDKGFVDTGVGTGGNEYIITEAGQVALGLTGAKKVSDAK